MIAQSQIVGVLSQAAAPCLARYHAAGDRAAFTRLLGRLGLWLAVVMVASVAVMALAGQLVIGLLFGPALVPYAAVATCLTLAAGLRNFNILLGRAITSMRAFALGYSCGCWASPSLCRCCPAGSTGLGFWAQPGP